MGVQGIHQIAPVRVGWILVMATGGWTLAIVIASKTLQLWGFRVHIMAGAMALVVGTLLIANLTTESSDWLAGAGMLLLGLGMGVSDVSIIVAFQNQVPWALRGLATSAMPFFRSLGGALGVGACGGLFNLWVARVDAPQLAQSLDERGLNRFEGLRALLDGDRRVQLPDTLTGPLADTLSSGLEPVFWVLTVAAVGTLLLTWFWPRGEADGRSAG